MRSAALRHSPANTAALRTLIASAMPRRLRPLTAACIPLAGALPAVASLFWTVHLRPSAGLLLSLKEGCVRLAWWDPSKVRFDYPPGISAGDSDQRWRLRWLPSIDRQALSTWVGLPLWIPAAAALALASLRRRPAPGQCPHCRYDRRGLDPAAPCPECGKLP